jgi:chaperone modulatory protein CbpM
VQPNELVGHQRLDSRMIEAWVEAGWLVPQQHPAGKPLSDLDLARANLIQDLRDLGVNDDSIPIILDLVDQLHGLRHLVRGLLSEVKAQRREDGRA